VHYIRSAYFPYEYQRSLRIFKAVYRIFPLQTPRLGKIDGKLVPIPFNFTSLETLFDKEKAGKNKAKLLSEYAENSKVSILQLLNSPDAV
jgi:UDP-galactopyranose mutase